ncbi:helix-turn-helix transcriptional regulator [Effusibacillus pohliae]|uniref:helix-turn-helix transcriptional regulator n=1 Tax=Effusibacillus pohliae TaxID=232270 RepID=UPI00039B74B7|nr:helix-turn-helix transcriptional regulator [Effusibacillus pohliae]
MKNRIRELLDGRPVTWLAEKSGVKRTTIHTYIKGGIPQLDKAYAIARVFGVSVYDIWPDL